jgi:predicted DNA-binding protein
MRMYSERLQILVSKEQRRRLEREAKRRGASVASLIRDAIDAQLGGVARDDRLRAVESIAAIKSGPYLPPDELRRAIDEARAEDTESGFPGLG